jgi:hypothetical protein
MTFSKAYAVLLLPLALGRAAFEVVPLFGLTDDLFRYCLSAVAFLAAAVLGSSVEGHYFREAAEGDEVAGRYGRFLLGLPLVYLGCLVPAGLIVYLTDFPWYLPLLFALGVLAVGLWVLSADFHHRGRRVMSLSYARAVAPKLLSPGEDSIPFGGVPVSARSHVCLVGTTGSGKTEALKEILRAELPKIGRGSDSRRAVLYDPKTEFWGFVRRFCPDVRTLHPFDQRGKSWGMCLDIRTPKAAGQFAATIIPPEDGPNSYFSNAARGILRGVMESFILNTPDAWTFRDLILACESEMRLRAVLSRNDETRSVVANYLDVREATSIFSSLDTFLAPFRPVAACWSKAEPLSLREWVDGNFVLLLPQDESARDVLGRLNALMFQFLTEQLLARETNAQLEARGQPLRGTVVCLDELRDIAKGLPGLTALLTRGRAYGVALRMGYQSQSGMQDALDRKAAELIGMCNYLGMLRVVERETAEYLSQTISDREVFRPSISISENGKSTSYQISRESAVLPGAFSELPTETLSGYFLAPTPLGLWRADLPWPWKTRASEAAEKASEPDFLPRKDADQYLVPWSESDLARLNLPLSLLHQEPQEEDRPDQHKRDTGPQFAKPPEHRSDHGRS